MTQALCRIVAFLLCFAAAPAVAQQAIVTPILSSAPNFRDLAGLSAVYGGTGFANVTSNFGVMRTGVFYRSDDLASLTTADWKTISSLGLGRDIDLRTPAEIAAAPDVVPAGATYTNINIYGTTTQTPFQSFSSPPRDGISYFENLYRGFVTNPDERTGFRTVLLTLARDPFPDLYHCSAGKDRTGWTSALLETIAGVSPTTVMKDYLATNHYTASLIAETRQAAVAADPATNPETVDVLAGVLPGYLLAALDQADASYGSIYGYLFQGLGLSLADIYVLRAKMVDYTLLPGQGAYSGNAASGAAYLNALQNSALSGRYTAYNFYLQSSVDLGSLGGVQGQVGGQVHADAVAALLRQPLLIDEALRPYASGRDLETGQIRAWLTGLGGDFRTDAGQGVARSTEQSAGTVVGLSLRPSDRVSATAGLGFLWNTLASAGGVATANTAFATVGGRYGFTGLDAGPYLTARLDGGYVDYQANRSLGGGLGSASGHAVGGLYSGQAGLGHVLRLGALALTPQVGLRATNATLGGVSESGGELALDFHGQSAVATSFLAELEARLEAAQAGAWTFSPALTLGYERSLSDPQITSTATRYGCAVSQKSAFDSRDLLKAGLGITARREAFFVEARANGLLGDGAASAGIGGQLSLGYTF